jgi:hypothetical protein
MEGGDGNSLPGKKKRTTWSRNRLLALLGLSDQPLLPAVKFSVKLWAASAGPAAAMRRSHAVTITRMRSMMPISSFLGNSPTASKNPPLAAPSRSRRG